MKILSQEIEIGSRTLSLEHGRLAQQANSAIVARYGDTMVLVTVVSAPLKQDLDYFPLTVDYMERLYAGGKIKGSRWVKREGRPSDEEILSARLIDRSIRPLFPKGYKKDVQVIATVLSVDAENDAAILSMVAASAAIATSNIPWNGPVGSLKIGAKNGDFFANPTSTELDFSELELVLTVKGENVLMLEAGAQQVPEEKILGAITFGQKEAQKIISGIEELAKKVGKEKETFEVQEDSELVSLIDKKFGEQILEFSRNNASKEGAANTSEIRQAIIAEVGDQKASLVSSAFEEVMKKRVRALMLSGKRLDGRKHDQIREITGEVGVLPRTHGSAIFTRGQTQALSATTLGSPSMEQLIESASGEESKRYMHQYSMPPYSSGETGRVGSPSRREIGHGALAERALLPVVPGEDKFPYTIRVVSEVMSSNGSTSMASTCGSTMSLMDAGVPITAPVSGIAMGLIISDENVAILSDITGIEDGMGDMDFKVTGTSVGVTAMQLDVKTDKLTLEILEKALKQAQEGRAFILGKMLEVIGESRAKISEYAPKIVVIKVPVERIGEIIGPGGKIIKKIMAETGVQIDVEDDGSVTVSGIDQDSVEKAVKTVEGIVKEVIPGELYEGTVKRIQPFGAFVEILPGKEGLVHVSDMAEEFVKDPQDIVKLGDKVKVWVKQKDDLGRLNLTMIEGGKKREPREPRGEQEFGERRFGGRGDSRRRDSGGRRGQGESGGPHFPASRFMTREQKSRFGR
ncbi:MAG: polyribonucleotide nucleotidyltransferase [Candidatus Blackburnbacteria bacterium RIFCSPHIGHO2_01_FULL_40_17]|uniref:Polyribonucleotide nucleotidyltransferase n=1 Tax=Candidatus Blackburnbacteria bacterium RIFCSPLOWO2_01_FULL_40_20 TaxID=1797519 RepID=A0A1G1VAZ5_9BACT|nr:MAG: Polyribonucleotide nucleotidyltransferase [Microgenomates group bacterium GW2011_GWA2_39_19]OGY07440.1 MAG: polyribonucleotide nucleotidyltransferase [Candidatus Blackburnbacteria bacterium RIFCSPHIGHO2_01_FULL_40_17]OGY12615.1 MAG: polyribonucleotide nucleotidyltransferase [Candidatus Blackburnbacteria bacterium RIFCSPLOWO2_01_FULL_40_20]HBL52074.1 polyribonucleotide nucleotidyltransferase [Candidatus Blackburnbacteria bacterium]